MPCCDPFYDTDHHGRTLSKPALPQMMYLYVIQVEAASGCPAESRVTIFHALADESTGLMHPSTIDSSEGICPDL
jgi:hypothetical protein